MSFWSLVRRYGIDKHLQLWASRGGDCLEVPTSLPPEAVCTYMPSHYYEVRILQIPRGRGCDNSRVMSIALAAWQLPSLVLNAGGPAYIPRRLSWLFLLTLKWCIPRFVGDKASPAEARGPGGAWPDPHCHRPRVYLRLTCGPCHGMPPDIASGR